MRCLLLAKGTACLLAVLLMERSGLLTAAAQQPETPTLRVAPAPRTPQPLVIPSDLPGSETPPITLPPQQPGANADARRAAIDKLYPAMPPVPAAVPIQPGPKSQPLTLSDLEQLAYAQSPAIRQAAADLQSARGAAIQAGAYPNPHVGYEADNIGTGNTAGYQGMNYSQEIATGGKLQLARSAAEVDVSNAQVALRRTQSEIATQLRTRYFAVLVALERMRVNQALAEFTANVYRVQIERVKVGEAAPYEPLQLRVLAIQAQAALVQAQHDYLSAWRQLAATLSTPDMAPTQLAGRVDQAAPKLDYQAVLRQVLSQHTNLITANNDLTRAQYQLRLAKVTPWVPNIDTSGAVQKDNTTAPYNTTVNVQVGATIPLWDRNRGNILSAEAAICRARQEYYRARDELAASLADAFARYETNATLVEYYRSSILPDQVRSYRGVYQRYQVSPDTVGFGDVVTAQQTLAQIMPTYLQAMSDQWQSVVDIAALLQVCNLSELETTPTTEPAPTIEAPVAPVPTL